MRVVFVLSIVIDLFALLSCKNDNIGKTPINIRLKDKPLSEIKSNVKGKWQLNSISGGICNACPPQKRKNEFYEFKTDTIKWELNGTALADTTIIWDKANVFGDTSWTMNFHDKNKYPYSLTPDGIYHDTLFLYQKGPDGLSFHLTKSK